MKIFRPIALLFFIFLGKDAFAAWDGTVTGTISQIHVTGANNYGFRVYLEGKPKMCGNEHNWAYINESQSNYNVYVSVLTAAKASNQTVKIYTNRKGATADGYCQIGYIVVS